MKKNLLFTSMAFCTSLFCLAQEPCATDAVHQSLMQSNADYRTSIETLEQAIKTGIENGSQKSASVVYIIPVVVHVIHLGEPVGTGTNISDTQIQGAIDGMNDRWRNIIGNGADMEIQFCLAPLDTNGNPSSGINRVDGSGVPNYSILGINANNPGCGGADETTIKNLSRWPVADYYNMWVVNQICGGWSGWAYYPWGAPNDGTSIRYSAMTSSSTIPAHELGHGFFLYHTFEGDGGNSACPQDSVCSNQGDRVCDTQPHKQSDCGTTNPCTGNGTWDNSRYNYMSYCSGLDRFSAGQKARAQAVLLSPPRVSLLLNAICPGTGINENSGKENVFVYPNPVTSLITVKGLKENSAVTITDLAGKVLLKQTAGENFSADLSFLEKGVYIFHSSRGARKIVKM